MRQAWCGANQAIAAFLLDERLQQQAAGNVIWLDEAGMIGTRTLKHVFDLAERNRCRVIVSGDWKQHSSPGERGTAMRLLEQEAGVMPARVTQIQRQQGNYRQAVALLASGQIAAGLDKLDELSWVHELDDESRYAAIGHEYADAVSRGESARIISPTHAEGQRVSAAVREELKSRGLLDRTEHQLPRLVSLNLTEAERADSASYTPGDVVIFHQNAKGFQKGDRFVIQDKLPANLAKVADRFQAYRTSELPLATGDLVRITAGGTTSDGHRLNNGAIYEVAGFTPAGNVRLKNGWIIGRDFGFLNQGYVATSVASQGKTVDRIILAQSAWSLPAASQEQAYVSLSRGRKKAVVFTDDKNSLREAMSRSDVRFGATELVEGRRGQRLKSLIRQSVKSRTAKDREQAERSTRKKELVHERT